MQVNRIERQVILRNVGPTHTLADRYANSNRIGKVNGGRGGQPRAVNEPKKKEEEEEEEEEEEKRTQMITSRHELARS